MTNGKNLTHLCALWFLDILCSLPSHLLFILHTINIPHLLQKKLLFFVGSGLAEECHKATTVHGSPRGTSS
jgi:hypothetical protein